jgi:catechol-2,3-dioxygenase
MLKDHDAIATIAVEDLRRARKFHEDTLGLVILLDTPATARLTAQGRAVSSRAPDGDP